MLKGFRNKGVESLEPLTEEERAILEDPHLFDDPSPEELKRLGIDEHFIERVQQEVMRRIKSDKGSSPELKG